MRVEFYRHSLTEEDIAAAAETMRGVFLTTGERNRELERALAELLGVPNALTTSSCTAALHVALVALGVGAGDEVVTTPLSFVATANVVLYCGATPVFADVEEDTGNVDAALVEAAVTERTRGVLPVHLYGQMADVRRLGDIAERHGLFLLEDAAHALEAERDGVRPGTLSDAAAFSFYATKNVTCGEGGAVVTRSGELAAKLPPLVRHGIDFSAAERYGEGYRPWEMTTLGYKYNLTNFQAALLLGQLARIEALRERRERIAARYEEAFAKAGVRFPKTLREDNRSARHLFTVWVEARERDGFMKRLAARGVGCAVNYRPIHLQPYYAERFGTRRGQFPVAERIGDETVTLPLYPSLRDEEVEAVIDAVIASL